MWLNQIGFRTRLLVLVAIFLVGMIGVQVIHWIVRSRLQVNGPLYLKIVEAKDIVADVLPPPEYLIESYLVVLQMVDEEATGEERKALIAKLKFLETDPKLGYRARHEVWVAAKLPEGPLKDALIRGSYEPALEFYRIANEDIVRKLEKLGDGPVPPEVMATVRGPLREKYDEHRRQIDIVVEKANKRVEDDQNAAAESLNFWTYMELTIAGGISLAVLALSWLIAQSIVKPTYRLIERMEDITQGAANLTQRVQVVGSDEIARLGELVNKMIGRLHDLIARLRVQTVELHTTGSEISASSTQQEAMIQGFSASTTQIAAAVKEISAAGQELLSTVNALRARADDASQVADAGRESLRSMQSNMQGLTDATSSISAKLGMIREKATGINAVVTTITKVADQTNLLSINAAIEAEKAGEAGRGFLVVAREIRRLADQTSVATLDIEQMVRHMQTAVSAGVMEMDKFHEGVRGSIERVTDVTGRMGQVIDQVQSLTQQFHVVREAVHQQSQGTQQIDDATSQLVSSVRQVAESVRGFNQASSNLRESASLLQKEVGQFQLEG